jgi:hypothetical protein
MFAVRGEKRAYSTKSLDRRGSQFTVKIPAASNPERTNRTTNHYKSIYKKIGTEKFEYLYIYIYSIYNIRNLRKLDKMLDDRQVIFGFNVMVLLGLLEYARVRVRVRVRVKLQV